MKFHSLMAVALLLLPCHSGAAPLHPDTPAGAAHAPAGRPAGAPGGSAAGVPVYQNGELVLDIRDTAGAEILRASLAYFFHDEHIATANELPAPAAVEAIPVHAQAAAPAAAAMAAATEGPAAAQLAEPWSLGLLGAGIALLGWTRRPGSWFDRLKSRLGPGYDIFPWPALSWLD